MKVNKSFLFHSLLICIYLTCHVNLSTCADAKLLVISLDGFRYDYLDKYSHLMPNLRFLASNGVHAVNGMQSTMATMTFPAHYTMATGLNEESHGLVSNAFWDRSSGQMFVKNSPDRKFYGGEPIWVTAKKHGHKTAVVIWIGNTVDWTPYNPDYNLHYDPTVSHSRRIDTALTLLNADTNLTMVYIDEPDATQHASGTFSPQVQQTLIRVDNLLTPVVRNATQGPLANKLNVLVLADHGLFNVTNHQRVNMTLILQKALRVAADYPSTISQSQRHELFTDNYIWADSGTVTHIYMKRSNYNRKQQANLLRRLITSNDTAFIYQAMYDTLYNLTKPVDSAVEWNNVTLYLKSQLPSRWYYSNHERIGDLVVIAKPGTMVNFLTKNVTLWKHAANHGYDNELVDMRALFVGYGPHFEKSHKMKNVFPQNCVYSLMCDILSAKPAPNNGSIEAFKGALRKKKNTALPSSMVSTLTVAPLILLSLLTFAI